MTFRFGEGKSGEAMPFKKFESSDEVEERKRKRQEEWEKVRRPDQPEVAPEEVYDPRSLYEQLQANKQKAEDAHEEKHRLSNQAKGLEDDEAAFLDMVSDRQVALENQRNREEQEALDEYRKALASSNTEPENVRSAADKKPQKVAAKASPKMSQLQLLKRAVKRKSDNTSEDSEVKKSKELGESASNKSVKKSNPNSANQNGKSNSTEIEVKTTKSATIRVGGILPGLCQYKDSDTSDSNSSSSDSDDFTDETKVKPKPPKVIQLQDQ